MCLVCFVSLPVLAIQIDDSISNITRIAYYGTTSGSLFNNLLFSILKCTSAIIAVRSALYSPSAIY